MERTKKMKKPHSGLEVEFLFGDIFDSECEAIVNPVNCVGIMGKGLAKQFKEKFPDNFQRYQKCCDSRKLTIGTCLTVPEAGKLIVNFPTDHYKYPSKEAYIEEGLDALVRHIHHFKIKSIAIPPIGCGLGGLDFRMVKNMIISKLKALDIYLELFLPEDYLLTHSCSDHIELADQQLVNVFNNAGNLVGKEVAYSYYCSICLKAIITNGDPIPEVNAKYL